MPAMKAMKAMKAINVMKKNKNKNKWLEKWFNVDTRNMQEVLVQVWLQEGNIHYKVFLERGIKSADKKKNKSMKSMTSTKKTKK